MLDFMSNYKFPRLCTIESVDGSCVTSFFVHECDSSTRMGSRPRRFLFTGHQNGSVQVQHIETQTFNLFMITAYLKIRFLNHYIENIKVY